MPTHIKLGTRKSALALAQANLVIQKLQQLDHSLIIDIVPISTTGDQDKTSPLATLGGKGVFIKTLENALLVQDIDIAVHSLKDVTCSLAPDTHIAAYLNPESRSDCFVFANGEHYKSLADIPKNITCATSSMRRKIILQHLRPDMTIKDIRGNIDTRIKKCQEGYADAVMLSSVGLIRLNRDHEIGFTCDPKTVIPAPGQGVIAIQKCKNIDLPILTQLNDPIQAQRSFYETLLLEQLGLDCNYPLGIYATLSNTHVKLDVCWSHQNSYRHHHLNETYSAIETEIHTLATHIKRDMQL